MVIKWPSEVPSDARQPTDLGRSCFGFERQGPSFWDRQRVRLAGNLLLLVSTGTVVVERPWQREAINAGGGCWLLPGDYRFSEVPDAAGRFRAIFVCFDDQAIAKSVAGQERIEAFCRIPNVTMYAIYPQPRLGRFLLDAARACGVQFPSDLRKTLLMAAVSGGSAMSTFLGHGFFARKTELNLWMENHVISNRSANDLAGLYPAGRRKFFSAFATHQTLSPPQWLRRRRMEIAATWIKHGAAPIEAIAKSFGYEDLERFRRDYIYERRLDPLREDRIGDAPILSGETLRSCITPFWHVAPFSIFEELRRMHQRCDIELPQLTPARRRHLLRHMYVDNPPKAGDPKPTPVAPAVLEAEKDFAPFWEMKATCAENVIQVHVDLFKGSAESKLRSIAA